MLIDTRRYTLAGFAAFAMFTGGLMNSTAVLAQDSATQARVSKLEAEVRALQRKVFPGGDGRFFEPQITGQDTPNSASTGPSTTAVTDILVRLDALETQLAGLTSQTEENGNAIRLLTDRIRLLEGGTASGASSAVTDTAASESNLSAMSGGASETDATPTTPPATPVTEATGPSAQRLEAVSKIAKPQTDNPGDDEYSYGYRLWNAGFYPEAQQQLTMFVEKYPSHMRATYGRNLLGRAYLDDGKPSDAAPWFLKNYQADKNARRAPDSLLYLAESMIALDDNKRACIALAEFGDTYPAVAAGRLANQYQANLEKVDCN